MKALKVVGLGLILALWSSCEPDFETTEFQGRLEFSRDTVFLDTVFNRLSSPTYSLKVYNRSNKDIFIPSVSLALGNESNYRLNVDGTAGKSFEQVEILAKDSIYIFIETTVTTREETEDFLYLDAIQFKSTAHLQEVPLVTLVKEATFLFPKKNAQGVVEQIPLGSDDPDRQIQGFFLKEHELKFTKESAYVIYGYAAVPPGKDLVIEAGARLHFAANSGLIIFDDASVQMRGAPSKDTVQLENEIIIQGDRLGHQFRNLPGQWGMIWLKKGSRSSLISNTTIKNGRIGLLVEGSPATGSNVSLKNLQIYNASVNGLRTENAHISGENIVINNSGSSSVELHGGEYEFKHVTFSNYWQQSYRQNPTLLVQNTVLDEPVNLKLNISNAIIYGNNEIELQYIKSDAAAFDLMMSHCLLKFRSSGSNSDPLYDFSNTALYDSIILNENPEFLDPRKNNLQLNENSAARDLGALNTALQVPLDLLNRDRTADPDLGAYEWTTTKEDENK
jgi:hypothetical protein